MSFFESLFERIERGCILRIKHYYRFPKHITDRFEGNVLDRKNWDILRTDNQTPFFSIPNDKYEYDEFCSASTENDDRASIIMELLYKHGLNNNGDVCSLGIGIGGLEWHIINKNPELKVCCTDCTEQALKKVSEFLDADQFLCFDLLSDDYQQISQFDWILMHRISTEFDFDTWRNIFKKAYYANWDKICFVPTELATSENAEKEARNHNECLKKGEKDMFCGWLYSEDEFVDMFSEWYEILDLRKMYNTGFYVLKRKART